MIFLGISFSNSSRTYFLIALYNQHSVFGFLVYLKVKSLISQKRKKKKKSIENFLKGKSSSKINNFTHRQSTLVTRAA